MALLWASAADAATYTVNIRADAKDQSTADGVCDASPAAGIQCTLRAAIQQANAHTANLDVIKFDIPGTGVQRIKPNTPLPAITDDLWINGYSQPEASINTAVTGTNAQLRIDLDGSDILAPGGRGLLIAGGTTLVRGLAINNFPGSGVEIADVPGTSGVIRGNFVGTNPAGTAAEPNGSGVITSGASTMNQIGIFDDRASRNLISGNANSGVDLSSSSNTVHDNLVGTDRTGTKDIGNGGAGVFIAGSDNEVTLNTIAYNFSNGVAVSSGIGNLIGANSIFFNDGLGIDLGNDGRTPNDEGGPADTDSGANKLQNFPHVLHPTTDAGGTTVGLTLSTAPNFNYVIRFYENPPGTNQGQTFLEAHTVHTNASGTFSDSAFPLTKTVPVGRSLTATATDPFRNTSEFSDPILVRSP